MLMVVIVFFFVSCYDEHVGKFYLCNLKSNVSFSWDLPKICMIMFQDFDKSVYVILTKLLKFAVYSNTSK